MNCVIIDNDPSDIVTLKEMIGRIPFLKLLRSFSNPFEGLEYIQEKTVDLVFLEMEMPNINGIDFVKSLRNQPQIIFMALTNQNAIAGYDLDATDYLLKPLSFDRFLKAVSKARLINRSFQLLGNNSVVHQKEQNLEFILVKTGYSTIRINLDEILCCEGLKDYIKIHVSGKSIITQNSLKKFEEILPEDRFIRIHKSFIIPLDKIDSIQNNRIIIHKFIIPIGEIYKTKFNLKISAIKV
jgi:DNA-binding LytR/AlgR family response regulator